MIDRRCHSEVRDLALRALGGTTITLVLVVVGDQVRVLAHALAIRRYAAAVQAIGARATDDAVVRRRAVARLTERGALYALCAVTEGLAGANRSPGCGGLCCGALGGIASALRKARLAGNTVARTVRTFGAAKCTDLTIPAGIEEVSRRTLRAGGSVGCGCPPGVA